MEWTHINLLIASAAALIPLLVPLLPRRRAGVYEGRPYHLVSASGHRAPSAVALGMPLETGVAFDLDPERGWERWLHRVGYLVEPQTGDPAFDGRVFIGAEHRAVARLLRERASLRDLVLDALATGAQLSCDGRLLLLRRRGTTEPDPSDFPRLSNLVAAFAPLPALIERSGDEPYTVRLTLYAMACRFIGVYGIGAAIPYLGFRPTLLLDRAAIWAPTAAILGITALLLLGALASMARTSRVGRMAVAWTLLPAIGLLPASLQAATELNTRLDRAEPLTTTCQVTQAEIGASDNTWDNRVSLGACSPAIQPSPPRELTLPPSAYRRLKPERGLLIQLSPGALGAAWLRDARPL